MTTLTRVLQLHEDRWRWLEDRASPAGAAAVVIGSYLVFAFDRFGWPDFAVRPTARLLLTGFYGWVGLAVAGWAIARLGLSVSAPLRDFVRLVGHAHLPLLVVGLLIQVVSVMFAVEGVAMGPALFVAAFWLPALLVAAVAAAADLSYRRAALVVVVPYLVWAGVVGRWVWRLLGHLL